MLARATPAELARIPRIRAELRPWRPLAFELQRRGYAARGRFCRDLQQAFCTDVGHHAASPRKHPKFPALSIKFPARVKKFPAPLRREFAHKRLMLAHF